jgi:predicted dehydrogenase
MMSRSRASPQFPNNPDLSVALIGAGRQGWRRAAALCASKTDRLIAVYDVDVDAAQRLVSRFGGAVAASWEDAIADDRVDTVVVCTPPQMHSHLAAAALRGGKHTLCEKPMGRSYEEAEQIATIARARKVVLKAGYNHRYHPGLLKCRAWFDQGRIGNIVFIRARYGIGGRPGYEADWRMRPELSGGGQLVDQGLHLLDLARWFLGDFKQAFGFTQSAFWGSAVEDNAFALLRTVSGQIASLHTSWTQWKNLFSFEIFGTEGYLTVNGLGGSYGTERVVFGKRTVGKPWCEESIEFREEDESWSKEWLDFKAAINEDREPLGGARDACEALRLAEAIYESARTGRIVAVR